MKVASLFSGIGGLDLGLEQVSCGRDPTASALGWDTSAGVDGLDLWLEQVVCGQDSTPSALCCAFRKRAAA
eukprot:360976-Chlamydomonas_euryale.AAC.3